MRAIMLAMTFFVIAQPALASVDSGESMAQTSTDSNEDSGVLSRTAILTNGIYTVKQLSFLIPRAYVLNGQFVEDSNITMRLTPKDHVSVRVEGDNVYVTGIVGKGLQDEQPTTYIFSDRDLAKTKFSFVMDGDETKLYRTYSEYSETEYARFCKAATEARAHVHFEGLCTTDVSDSNIAANGYSSVSCNSSAREIIMWGGGHAVSGHRGNCGHMAYVKGMSNGKNGALPGDPGHKHPYELRGCYARNDGGNFSIAAARRHARTEVRFAEADGSSGTKRKRRHVE
jgi:hypothetical protein